MSKDTKIAIDLGDEELVKAIKNAASEQGKSIREVSIEAFQEWLAKRITEEDKDDLKAMLEAEKEYRKTGGRLFEEVVKDSGKES